MLKINTLYKTQDNDPSHMSIDMPRDIFKTSEKENKRGLPIPKADTPMI